MPTLSGLVGINANRVPCRDAVIEGGVRLSWADLDAEVGEYAAALAGAGVRKGDRVAVVSANTATYLKVVFGVLRLGAVIVPVNTRLAPPELRHVLSDCDPEVILTEPAAIDRAVIAAPGRTVLALGPAPGHRDLTAEAAGQTPHAGNDVAEFDDAMIIYTSGTTGSPKGALHSHHSAIWAALSQIAAASLRDGERFLHTAPLYHAGGMVFLSAITLLGGTHVMAPGFNAADTIEEVKRSGITCILTVPTVLQMVLGALPASRSAADMSSWTRAIVGGSAVPEPTLHEVFTRLPHVQISQMCGQTESGPAGLFSTDAQMRARPSASGHQGEPFVEVRVVDCDGNTVPSGTVGELLFRGETVMKGYWRRPEETAATIRDGWLHTGDLVRVEADGSYTMVDRAKDMIITGGRNVYSVEVEQAIASHPDVLECAVIASPHELFGESILAVVNPRPGRDVTLSSLKQHCRQLIADYKLPHLLVLDRIPRNANGKVQKAVLRRAYAQPSPKGSP
jgi:fatty-acyl-CoA synthase